MVRTALVDLGRLGVADRYCDLALAVCSLGDRGRNPRYGAWYADRFLTRCGITPVGRRRIAFCQLLDEFG